MIYIKLYVTILTRLFIVINHTPYLLTLFKITCYLEILMKFSFLLQNKRLFSKLLHNKNPTKLHKISLPTLKMCDRQALLLSSSNCHGYSMLEFAKEEICTLLNKNNIKELLFVPFAQNNFDEYTNRVREVIHPWGFTVIGLHTNSDPMNAVSSAKAIFIGGGNTFLLLKRLYTHNLVHLIKQRVLEGKLVYIGSSAGTNVATKSIHTTNDMPIIYPPSFEAIGLIPFNINPHYIDNSEIKTHKGETRDQRIGEYMEMPHAKTVLGLREGSILHVHGSSLILKGVAGAVLFQKGGKKTEYSVGENVSFLLEEY